MAAFTPAQDKAESTPGPADGSPLGLYVHVPFCATTCDFCAFYQTVPKGDAVRRYLEGVEAEAALLDLGGRRPGTAFWGGGTPGLLRTAELLALGQLTRKIAGGAPAEWTVELAPATVTEDRLAVLAELGVTRVSLGVQSFRPELLEALGRQHSREQVYRAWDLVRARGFRSVNLDLMFALPNQDAAQWRADLAEAVRLGPDHLSTYCLTFEEDTALWVKLSQGRVKLDPEKEAHFYTETWEFLAGAGYPQYEVSNFARPGHECRHNLHTWRMHEWVGLGPSAASQHAGWRGSNPPDLALWLGETAAGRRGGHERTALTPTLLAADAVVFGLRLNEGVALPRLQRRWPGAPWPALFDLLPRLLHEGLLTSTPEGTIRLTTRGRLLADAVGGEVLGAFEPVQPPA
jgi:oxygen-independent coproporphyrinogen III oxidase